MSAVVLDAVDGGGGVAGGGAAVPQVESLRERAAVLGAASPEGALAISVRTGAGMADLIDRMTTHIRNLAAGRAAAARRLDGR